MRFDVKPNEDAFLASKKFPIFAVADGVTQSHYPNGRYALPYGAKEAAHIFCRSIIKYLEKSLSKSHSDILQNVRMIFKDEEIKNQIIKSFDSANVKIKKLNEKHGIQKRMDYKEHDWFDTVGIVAAVFKNELHYGFVGDCGLIIFDKDNNKKFQTKDMVRPAVKRFNEIYPDWKKLDPLKRQFIIRKDFRNNPNKKGYGSFTGQTGVEHYYAIGKKKLNKGDVAVLYSDGFFELLKDRDFIKILRKQNKKQLNAFVMQKAKTNPHKYGDDRTFVSIIF